ncbi:hypothetical protein MTR_1g090590 [Medicago truncatula]|uniref:Uncharacterized protein n=1 Tax=Medicago truncatula TaxID=3880 RepID=G7I411_MEDTR|nr:hypothetical protein MTR_1g090590 [Medicago truncatula]
MDDMNDDIHLKPENIEFLLPRDIFDELFVEKPRAKLFESLSVNVDLGSQEEITAQDEILLHDSFLQARAIINELFLEKPTESLLESLRGTVNKDIWKEIFAQAVNFAQDSSTHIVLNDEIREKNEEHVVPKSTWAEIVKGEPRNFNVNSIGYEASFPPLTSSVNAEKLDKKGIPPIMNMHQTCEENKKCKKNNKGHQMSVGKFSSKKRRDVSWK